MLRILEVRAVIAFAGLLTLSTGLAEQPYAMRSTGWTIKVEWRGAVYNGLVTILKKTHEGFTTTHYSGVMLKPIKAHPDIAVGLVGGDELEISYFHLGGDKEIPVIGRYVGITDAAGSTLTLFPTELPVAAYKDPKSLARAVQSIISGKGSTMGADRHNQSRDSRGNR